MPQLEDGYECDWCGLDWPIDETDKLIKDIAGNKFCDEDCKQAFVDSIADPDGPKSNEEEEDAT